MKADQFHARIQRWSDYLSRYRSEDGMISELDLALYLLFLLIQDLHDEDGDLAELGVYHGGPFALLTGMRRQSERAFAIDIFDLNTAPDGRPNGVYNSPEEFRATVRRITGTEPDCVMIRANTTIPEQAMSVRAQVGNRCRFFHVDGGHKLSNIRADLLLARDCTAGYPSPIIAVDDTFSPQMPEVTDGLIEFLRQPVAGDLVPFLITNRKTYLCRRADSDRFAKYPFIFLRNSLCIDSKSGLPIIQHLAGSPCCIFGTNAPATLRHLDLGVFEKVSTTTVSLPRLPEAEQ